MENMYSDVKCKKLEVCWVGVLLVFLDAIDEFVKILE